MTTPKMMPGQDQYTPAELATPEAWLSRAGRNGILTKLREEGRHPEELGKLFGKETGEEVFGAADEAVEALAGAAPTVPTRTAGDAQQLYNNLVSRVGDPTQRKMLELLRQKEAGQITAKEMRAQFPEIRQSEQFDRVLAQAGDAMNDINEWGIDIYTAATQAIKRLKGVDQKIAEMYYLQRLPQTEIAKALKTNQNLISRRWNAIAPKLERAVEKIRIQSKNELGLKAF